MGRPSQKLQHMAEVHRLYLTEERTLSEISRTLGVSVQTLSRWLREDGIELQVRIRNPNAGRSTEDQARINDRIRKTKAEHPDRKAGGRKALPREERQCARPDCPHLFLARVDQPDRRFCSQGCALWTANAQKIAEAQSAWEQDPSSQCPCGSTIPYEHRHDWRYCSERCRESFGAKRRPDPDNHITLVCQNPQCGKEFSRYRKLYTDGQRTFCSNACATKVTKAVAHVIDMSTSTVLDSGWEALFFGLCKFLKVPCERVDRALAVEWKPGHWYAPDFKVGSTFIEVKGVEDGDDQARWEAWNGHHGRLLVVDERLMNRIRKMSRTEFLKWSGLSETDLALSIPG